MAVIVAIYVNLILKNRFDGDFTYGSMYSCDRDENAAAIETSEFIITDLVEEVKNFAMLLSDPI